MDLVFRGPWDWLGLVWSKMIPFIYWAGGAAGVYLLTRKHKGPAMAPAPSGEFTAAPDANAGYTISPPTFEGPRVGLDSIPAVLPGSVSTVGPSGIPIYATAGHGIVQGLPPVAKPPVSSIAPVVTSGAIHSPMPPVLIKKPRYAL